MINYGELEDAALFGLEESINNGNEVDDDGWFEDEDGTVVGEWQGGEIAEALYCHFLGYDK